MARRPGPCPDAPGSFAGPPRCRARVGGYIARTRTAAGMTSSSPPASGTRAARVTDYAGDPGRLAPSKDFLSALEGLALSVWRIDAAVPMDGPSVRVPSHVRRGGDAGRPLRWEHGNREHLCGRPNVARIAVGGEPGERGATKAGTCFCGPRHGRAPGRRTAKGVSTVDSALPTPGNEGLSKFDSSGTKPARG
jgi:hypothetical protein